MNEQKHCLVSNMVFDGNYKVCYMYLEEPDNENDSGWRFLVGNEDSEYMANADNFQMMTLKEMVDYDTDILPYLNRTIEQAYIRINSTDFTSDDGSSDIYIEHKSI